LVSIDVLVARESSFSFQRHLGKQSITVKFDNEGISNEGAAEIFDEFGMKWSIGRQTQHY
jgi:hypothetical protein